MKTICVSGSVGTGKTTISKKLAKALNYKYIDVHSLIKKNRLYDSYDRKDKSYVVDVKKLNLFLLDLIEENQIKKTKGLILDSHMSHFLPAKLTDICIITKCNIEELSKRLKKRKYPKRKIQENIECEIFDICLSEAKDLKHKILVIDTTKTLNIDAFVKKIRGKLK